MPPRITRDTAVPAIGLERLEFRGTENNRGNRRRLLNGGLVEEFEEF